MTSVMTDFTAMVLGGLIAAVAVFSVWMFRNRYHYVLPRIYLAVSLFFILWIVALLVMRFVPAENEDLLWLLDAITNISGSLLPPLCLLISMAFTHSWDRMPRWAWLIFIVPTLTIFIIFTNPLHHIYYANFSVIRSQLSFGPYIFVSGAYNYVCMITGMILFLRFAYNNPSSLYRRQCTAYLMGVLVPFIISVIATLGIVELPITATPLSFTAALVFHGLAIYQLHLFDVQPIANQQVLDSISDCYLILSDTGLVLSMNEPFRSVFGVQYGIEPNKYLSDCSDEIDRVAKTPVYNLLTAVDNCREGMTKVTFEQAVTLPAEDGAVQRLYYIAEISPFVVREKFTGVICMYKDITALKNSMQQLENSRMRMVEQERLAFLGQMVGGLAHNLKTPIMSISGCVSAFENLVEEGRESLGDPEVNDDDYREIFGEMDEWVTRVRDSCAYMSDIITAVKGQAANASVSEDSAFTVSELIKRVTLLMRHELLASGCQLESESNVDEDIILHGDVNNLIQVLNNLISNAIYAQKLSGGGVITLGIGREEEKLDIFVRDTGPGIDPKIQKKLFREMATSKGNQGTGLGLFISGAIVRGKFGGEMWAKDNPEGGSIVGMSIPLENVTFSPHRDDGEGKEARQ